jgi:hypothetical protein
MAPRVARAGLGGRGQDRRPDLQEGPCRATCEGYRKQMLFFRDRKREVEEENDNLRVDVLRLKDETDKQKALILSYEARLDKLSASDPDKMAIEVHMAHSQAWKGQPRRPSRRHPPPRTNTNGP